MDGDDGTGNIRAYQCNDKADQRWSTNSNYCYSGYCNYINEKTGNKCLDPEGKDGKGDVRTNDCQSYSDQRWKFYDEASAAYVWSVPQVSWD